MPAVGSHGVQVLTHLTVLVNCSRNIQTEVQNILTVVGFRFGGRAPMTRNDFTNCYACMEANLSITPQLSALSKLFLFFDSQSSNWRSVGTWHLWVSVVGKYSNISAGTQCLTWGRHQIFVDFWPDWEQCVNTKGLWLTPVLSLNIQNISNTNLWLCLNVKIVGYEQGCESGAREG